MNRVGRITTVSILIVNADSEFGAYLAVEFARLKSDLVLVGQSAEDMVKTVKQCKRIAKKPIMIVSDVDDEEELDGLIKETIRKYRRCDIAVNAEALMENMTNPDENALKPFVLTFGGTSKPSGEMSDEVREQYRKFLKLSVFGK